MTPWLLRHNTGALDGAAESYVNRVADTGDGFVFATSFDFTHVTKVDYEGNVQWQLTDINTYEAVVGADTSGNVFILDHARLTKVNSAGVIQWQKTTSTGFIAQPELVVLADGSCLVVSGNTNTVLRVAKFSSAGLLTWEKTYTGTDEVVNATKAFFENSTGDLFHFTTGTFGDDYLRLTKHTSALAVTWTKSYKIANNSLGTTRACKLADGGLVIAYMESQVDDTLRVAKIAQDGTVTWTKHVTDSALSNYFMSGYSLSAGATGFFVHTAVTASGALIYKFDDSGAFEWARVFSHPSVSGGWRGSIIANAQGVLVGVELNDADSNAVASCFYLRSDGTPIEEFASATAEVSDWTSVSVASGDTLTVAADTDSVVAATAGTITTNAAEVTASNYPLLRYYPDLFQLKQASGSRVTHFGAPTSPFDQAGSASGALNTLFGVASSLISPAYGTTICQAAGTKVTKVGTPVDNSSFASAATGTLVSHFGTGHGLASHAATGYNGTHYGSPNGRVLTYAGGVRNTQFGTPVGKVVGVAVGVRNTQFGTAVADWGNTGTAAGLRGTHFGAPGSYSVFHAIGSRRTRFGTARLVRSVTC